MRGAREEGSGTVGGNKRGRIRSIGIRGRVKSTKPGYKFDCEKDDDGEEDIKDGIIEIRSITEA